MFKEKSGWVFFRIVSFLVKAIISSSRQTRVVLSPVCLKLLGGQEIGQTFPQVSPQVL